MDDQFLRSVAVLQANLMLLEEQSDALSDFSDMQNLRKLKSQLADYIEAHASKGGLPPDPFQILEKRIKTLSLFFLEAEKEILNLLDWNQDWLKAVPWVTLADLQTALKELAELFAHVPEIQARLKRMVSPLDWTEAGDIHGELVSCAAFTKITLVAEPGVAVAIRRGGIILPGTLESSDFQAAARNAYYEFIHGRGELERRLNKHLAAMERRIHELLALHSEHLEKIRTAEAHLTAHDFRSAARVIETIKVTSKRKKAIGFKDVPYESVLRNSATLFATYQNFVTSSQALEEELKGTKWKTLPDEFSRLRSGISKPESELGMESLALLVQMESRLAEFMAARKSRHFKITTFAIVLIFLGAAATLYVIDAYRKTEKIRMNAATEAKAKLPSKIDSVTEGELLNVPIPGDAMMRFAFCPAGNFTMGSPFSEEGRDADETQISVLFTKGFWLAQTEVTQAQWKAVMGSLPSFFKGDLLPVENVSWDDGQAFIAKLNHSGIVPAGWKFSLPTEAQWEYGCRAGTGSSYSGGPLDAVGWHNGNSAGQTHPVATKAANAWGLNDMCGNVWEWCADSYESLPGSMDSKGSRVDRGGSWSLDPTYCRAANRNGDRPSERRNNLGFRPALVPTE